MCIVSPRCSCVLLTSISAFPSYTYVYTHSLAFHNTPERKPYQRTLSLICALQSYFCHLHWIRKERRQTARFADNLFVYKKPPIVTRYNRTKHIHTGCFCHSVLLKRALAWYSQGDCHSHPAAARSRQFPSKTARQTMRNTYRSTFYCQLRVSRNVCGPHPRLFQELYSFPARLSLVGLCYKETLKGEGRKREVSKQETKRHTQGADPATQADTVAAIKFYER
jgi:hypothetical protein